MLRIKENTNNNYIQKSNNPMSRALATLMILGYQIQHVCKDLKIWQSSTENNPERTPSGLIAKAAQAVGQASSEKEDPFLGLVGCYCRRIECPDVAFR